MYGMLNKAVEEIICLNHGEAKWEEIKTEAGVEVEVFMSNEAYPDEITYRLVAAASRLLNTPAEAILMALGERWILHTAQEGYSGLMQAAGRNLPEFLRNLPNFHSRVSMIFPKLQPPKFQCTDETDSSLTLHYYSNRQGLAPFVVGLMRGLGKRFDMQVTARHVADRTTGADHDIFEVTWTAAQPQ